jgi:hypothetical protein
MGICRFDLSKVSANYNRKINETQRFKRQPISEKMLKKRFRGESTHLEEKTTMMESCEDLKERWRLEKVVKFDKI